jgi:hypothetical protein
MLLGGAGEQGFACTIRGVRDGEAHLQPNGNSSSSRLPVAP